MPCGDGPASRMLQLASCHVFAAFKRSIRHRGQAPALPVPVPLRDVEEYQPSRSLRPCRTTTLNILVSSTQRYWRPSRLRKNSCVLCSLGVDRPNSFTSTPREVHDAWSGYSASRAVSLPVARGARASDASPAAHPGSTPPVSG